MAFGTNFTYEQVQELLKAQQEESQKMFVELVSKMTQMNPMQQKSYDEQVAQEKRRANMVVALGKAEEEAAKNRKFGCSHMVYPAGHRRAGEGAPKGALGAEWITGGQAYQNGTAMVMCLRCQSVWLFRPGSEMYNSIIQNGLLGEAPPPPESLLCNGCLELEKQCKCAELNDANRNAREMAAISA